MLYQLLPNIIFIPVISDNSRWSTYSRQPLVLSYLKHSDDCIVVFHDFFLAFPWLLMKLGSHAYYFCPFFNAIFYKVPVQLLFPLTNGFTVFLLRCGNLLNILDPNSLPDMSTVKVFVTIYGFPFHCLLVYSSRHNS